VNNTFGYDYVLNLNFATMSYDVYSLTAASTFKVFYNQNDESNPWRYFVKDGDVSISKGVITYNDPAVHIDDYGLLGDHHNVVTGFDLSFLMGQNFTAHFTMDAGMTI